MTKRERIQFVLLYQNFLKLIDHTQHFVDDRHNLEQIEAHVKDFNSESNRVLDAANTLIKYNLERLRKDAKDLEKLN